MASRRGEAGPFPLERAGEEVVEGTEPVGGAAAAAAVYVSALEPRIRSGLLVLLLVLLLLLV